MPVASQETHEAPRPWLSVLMPTFNGSAYVAAALESVAAERDVGVEVIVVDDGSRDDTLAIVASFADRLQLKVLSTDDGYRIHSSHALGNWVASTNRALAAARGEYVCCLHQDDCWLPGRLSQVRAALDRWGHADLILHPSRFIDAAGQELGALGLPVAGGGRAAG